MYDEFKTVNLKADEVVSIFINKSIEFSKKIQELEKHLKAFQDENLHLKYQIDHWKEKASGYLEKVVSLEEEIKVIKRVSDKLEKENFQLNEKFLVTQERFAKYHEMVHLTNFIELALLDEIDRSNGCFEDSNRDTRIFKKLKEIRDKNDKKESNPIP